MWRKEGAIVLHAEAGNTRVVTAPRKLGGCSGAQHDRKGEGGRLESARDEVDEANSWGEGRRGKGGGRIDVSGYAYMEGSR